MPATNYFATQILNQFLITPTTYLALHLNDPTAAGLAGTEFSGGSYVRKVATWTFPSTRTVSNNGTITWNNLPAATLKFMAVWDSLTGGNCLYRLAVTPNIVIVVGNTFTVPINDLSINLS